MLLEPDDKVLLFDFASLNTFKNDRSLLQYQYLIATKTPFGMCFGNLKLVFVKSYCRQGKNVCIFKSEENFYEIESFGPAKAYSLRKDLTQIKDYQNVKRFKQCDIKIRTGHANFAHFIWNQLPALLALGQEVLQDACIFQEHDTIVSTTKIKADLLPFSTEDLSADCELYVGSECVDDKTRAFLRNGLNAPKPSPSKVKHDTCRVYLGIRGPGQRALLNEYAFYKELMLTVSEKLSNKVEFYLDGFSFQNDNTRDKRAQERCASIDNIIDNLKNDLPNLSLISLNGKNISYFINLEPTIDFYVTHEGTMQHKIAWLTPEVKGFLLTGSKTPKSVASWHSNQVLTNGSQGSIYTFLTHETEQENTNSIERNNSFRIKDLRQTALRIANIIKQECCFFEKR